MCENKNPIFEGEDSSLGKFKVFETKNGARKYIVSQKFGMMNMQGKRQQETVMKLMSEPVGEQISEKKPVPKKERTGFWGFSNE